MATRRASEAPKTTMTAAMHFKLTKISGSIALALTLLAGPAIAADPTPAQMHATAVRAARAGDFATAVPTLERLVRTQPRIARYRFDLVAVLSWAEQHQQALAAAKGLDVARLPEYVLAALARSARLGGDRPLAVRAYRILLKRRPDSADYRRGLELATIPAPAPAPAPAAPQPGTQAPPEEDPAETGAREIRAARQALAASWTADRYATLDAALANNAQRIAEADERGAGVRARRLRLDRIEALALRGRSAEALALGDELSRAAPLPAYVEAQLGDALMSLREPQAAAARYRAALALDPDRIEWLQALYYAELEAEHHVAADAVIERLAALTAAAPERLRRDNAILAARAALYAERPALAQARIDAVLDQAPEDAGAQIAAAGILAARGAPRSAEAIYRSRLSARPDDIDARIGLTEALRMIGDRAAADALARELANAAPEHPGVHRLLRDQAVLARPELDSRIEVGSGAGSVTGNRDLDWHTYLYSAPIDSRWRVFAHHLRTASDYDGGSPRHERIGLGAEHVVRDWQTVAEIGQAVDNGRDQTLALRTSWSAGDNWSLRAGFEHNTDDLPLKGRSATFQTLADRYSAALSYRWNESRALSFGVVQHDFNDGNRRTAFSLGLVQRLISEPGFSLDLAADAYTSRGERVDVAYFNPRRDTALSLGLDARIRGWRSYARSLTHVVSVTAGRYDEHAFGFAGNPDPEYGWKPFYAIRYGHRWQLGPALAVDYGAGLRMFPYDGKQEHRSFLYAGVNWRF